MFIQITEDGTYLGSSARSTKGYFPVSHELSKSLRSRVIRATANVRRAIGTTPEPVKLSIEELWADIKDDPYSLVETYADIYSFKEKIDLGVVIYVKNLREVLERNADKIVEYFVDADKVPSNLFAIAVSLANGDEIVEALYEETPVDEPEPEIEVIVAATPEEVPDNEPATTEPTPDLDQIEVTGDESPSDGKRVKGKRSKGRGGSGVQPHSKQDTNGAGQTESSTEPSD